MSHFFFIFAIFSRVNKRWNRILSYTHAWTHVDFWQEQKTDKNWETEDNKSTRRYMMVDANTWIFPIEENAVLDFLKKYTGGSLKSIYLHVASKQIIAHLNENYGNLQTISFLSPKDTSYSAFALTYLNMLRNCRLFNLDSNQEFEIPVSESVKVLEFPIQFDRPQFEGQQDKLLTCLRKSKNLQRLTITKLRPQYLSPDSLDVLSQDIREVNLLKIFVERRGCRGYRGPNYSSQLSDSLLSLLKITEMKVFRISIEDPSNAGYDLNIDEFLSGIADKWHELRTLALGEIHPPSDRIVRSIMTSLTQLRELELYGRMVTDETVALIAEYLKRLTSVKLSNGTYTPSGMKALCGHPSIERLYLMQENQSQLDPDWVLAVYDVILSLAKINYVKLVGFRVVAIHAKEDIPPVSPTIQIEVQNAYEFNHPLRIASD